MFPVRTKVIMVIACGVGIAAGALTYLASRSVPQDCSLRALRLAARRSAPPVHRHRA